MRTFYVFGLSLSVLLGAGEFCTAIGQSAQVTINVRITTAENLPLRGDVAVTQGGPNVSVSNYQTNSQGWSSFQAIRGEAISIVVKADGYISSEREVVSDLEGSTITFALSPAGKVSGRIVDEIGKPVGGAVVRVRYSGRRRAHQLGQEVGEVTTDDFGYFTLPFVARGNPFVIDVAAPDRPTTSSLPMTLPGESLSGILIALPAKGQVVRGTVLDSFGQPAYNVNVRLRLLEKPEPASDEFGGASSLTRMLQGNRAAITAPDGSFEFAGVPAGDIVLIARRGNAKPAAVKGHVAAAGTPLEVVIFLGEPSVARNAGQAEDRTSDGPR